MSTSLDEMIDRRAKFLTDYQDAAYAKRYADFVAHVRKIEGARQPGSTELTEAVARYYFKLLAIKDEYEVARLYAEIGLREARGDAVRRRLQAHVPSRAAHAEQARREDGRAAQVDVRPVDDVGVPRAREDAPFPRRRARHLRQVRQSGKMERR